MTMAKPIIERIYNKTFRSLSPDEEWRKWHEKISCAVSKLEKSGARPKELSDPTEIKYYEWLLEDVMRLIGPISKLLEVGCGSGALSLALCKETGADCTLVDNEDIALEYAKMVIGDSVRASYVNADATKLPFSDKSFDFVHSVGLIEHFENSTVEKMISEMLRVTEVGGYVYLAVPNYFSPDLLGLWRKNRKGTERYMPVRKLRCYVQRNDFEIVASGHGTYTFDVEIGRWVPVPIERFLGSLGFGFLNYVLLRRNA